LTIGAFRLARQETQRWGSEIPLADEMDRKPVAVNAGFLSSFLPLRRAKLKQAEMQSASSSG